MVQREAAVTISPPATRTKIEPLSADNFAQFAAFHRAPSGRGCFCMYWHFGGDNRAWQLQQEQDNESAKQQLVLTKKTFGLLLFADNSVRATVQLEPRVTLTKLTVKMPYRDLGPPDGVWSVGCLLVDPAYRRRGFARALITEAIGWTRTMGAIALEAYPRLGDELRDDEVWTGPNELFRSLGFVCVREHGQYPVLRRELSLSSAT
jgi:GNAT superfamily N-acetyltransferase